MYPPGNAKVAPNAIVVIKTKPTLRNCVEFDTIAEPFSSFSASDWGLYSCILASRRKTPRVALAAISVSCIRIREFCREEIEILVSLNFGQKKYKKHVRNFILELTILPGGSTVLWE
jgi:hypothetical protein